MCYLKVKFSLGMSERGKKQYNASEGFLIFYAAKEVNK